MTAAFRCAHAGARDWREAAGRCVAALGTLPVAANLGFLYFTDHYAPNAAGILDLLRERTGIAHWVGSVGMGVIAVGAEYMDEPGMAILVGAFPEQDFRLFSGKSRPPARAEKTASGAVAADFAVVHGDLNTADMSSLIEDMSHKLDSGFLTGGLTSSRCASVQIAGDVLEGGLSGVVFSSDVKVRTALTQGCSPIRAGAFPLRHRLTGCEGHVIETLDGRPALEVFMEDIGVDAGRDLRRAAMTHLAGFPVEGSDTEDFLARNIVGFDAKRKLVAVGADLETGMEIMFCRRDRDAALEDLDRMLDRLVRSLDKPPRGALYISCVARGANMFGEKGVEAEAIGRYFPSLPFAGFYANGEISHDRLYGYTGVLTLFI